MDEAHETDQPTDVLLVRAVRAAPDLQTRADAFDPIVRRHHRSVLSWCAHHLADQDAALDVAQVTFEDAFRSFIQGKGPDDETKLEPWLIGIAKLRRLAFLRRLQVTDEHRGVLPGGQEALDEVPEDAEARSGRATRAAHVQRLVDRVVTTLSERDQEIYRRRFVQEDSAREIAVTLKVSEKRTSNKISIIQRQVVDGFGALILAEEGRRHCPDLAAILDSAAQTVRTAQNATVPQPEPPDIFTSALRERIVHHFGTCKTCDNCATCIDKRRQLVGPYVPALIPILAAPELLDRITHAIRQISTPDQQPKRRLRRPRKPSTRITAGLGVLVVILVILATLLIPRAPASRPAPAARSKTSSTRPGPSSSTGPLDIVAAAGSVEALDQATGAIRWQREIGYVKNPVTADGTVFTADSETGRIYALRETTGAVLWTYQAPNIDDFSDVAAFNLVVGSGLVYFDGVGNNELYALDVQTGEVRWTYQTPGLLSAPAMGNGVVYVVDLGSSTLYALDATTGAVRWTHQGVDAVPILADGLLFPGANGTGLLYALDATTGVVRWTYQSADYTEDPGSAEVVVGGTVYYNDIDASILYALDAATGAVRWQYQTTGLSNAPVPVVSGSTVYLIDGNGLLSALDAATGTVNWTYNTNDATAVPAVAGGLVYFFDSISHTLYALHAATGKIDWTNNSSAIQAIDSSVPVIVGSTVYFNTDTGPMFALNVATGELLWSQAGPASG
jgi:RNA polymerase sigma factor (sigma-70 family)